MHPGLSCIGRHQCSIVQIGRGNISLADAYLHSYQESKVPIVTPVGKHAGEVEIFFAFASKEVSDTPSKLRLPDSCLLLDIFLSRTTDSAHYTVKVDEWCSTQAASCLLCMCPINPNSLCLTCQYIFYDLLMSTSTCEDICSRCCTGERDPQKQRWSAFTQSDQSSRPARDRSNQIPGSICSHGNKQSKV